MSISSPFYSSLRPARARRPGEPEPGQHPHEDNRISVIVPVHNGGTAFKRCIASILDTLGPSDELIVVADGESDGAWRELAVEQNRVMLVVQENQAGPAAARNRGAKTATGDLLLFLDADVVAHSDTIEKVRSAFSLDEELDALMGSYDDNPSDQSFLSQYRNLLHHHTHQTASEEASTFWAGCGAIRRDVFERAGGFDAGYRNPCVEDIELGYRLRAAGHKIRLRKDIQVTHLKAWNAKSITRTDLYSRAVPWTQLLLQKRTFENDLNITHSGRASVFAVWLLPLAGLLAFWSSTLALALAATLIGLLVLLNRSFYHLLFRKRGPAFALKALPWHTFYFAYCGLGFVIGAFHHARRSAGTPASDALIIDPDRSSCTTSPLSSSVPVRQV